MDVINYHLEQRVQCHIKSVDLYTDLLEPDFMHLAGWHARKPVVRPQFITHSSYSPLQFARRYVNCGVPCIRHVSCIFEIYWVIKSSLKWMMSQFSCRNSVKIELKLSKNVSWGKTYIFLNLKIWNLKNNNFGSTSIIIMVEISYFAVSSQSNQYKSLWKCLNLSIHVYFYFT